MLYNARLADKEKEGFQYLLNEARHNLTFTDNIYKFNADTCSDVGVTFLLAFRHCLWRNRG